MVKIDLKDRKILYYLDLNSRQSFAEIGKKVGLSKNAITYRIKRLEKEGLINNYYTAINFKIHKDLSLQPKERSCVLSNDGSLH